MSRYDQTIAKLEREAKERLIEENFTAQVRIAALEADLAAARAEVEEMEHFRADILDLTRNHSDVRMDGHVQYVTMVQVRDIHRALERYGYPPKDSRWTGSPKPCDEGCDGEAGA